MLNELKKLFVEARDKEKAFIEANSVIINDKNAPLDILNPTLGAKVITRELKLTTENMVEYDRVRREAKIAQDNYVHALTGLGTLL